MPRKKSTLTEQVWFRLNVSELVKIDLLADKSKMTRAAFIRILLLYALSESAKGTPDNSLINTES
jgi:hypothetical protein